MPKETIHTDDPDEPITGHEVTTETNLIDVSWGKGLCHVQIGVRERDHLPGDRETAHYATITDRQIDELVAALLKAKRQAYPKRPKAA